MKEYIKKFANPAAADQYAIKDIPFIASVDGDPIQNLHCNLSGKKLVNVNGIVEVQSAGPEPPEMIDLGLPSGILWGAHNLGANPGNTPESYYGGYYAWGETETKENYNWSTYKYANGASDKLTKYCPTDKTNYWNGTGSPDGKTILEAEDDVATITNSAWRMPTKEDFEELITVTTNSWVTDYNGISGLNGIVFAKVTITRPAFKNITLYSPMAEGEITDEMWKEISVLTLEEINTNFVGDIRTQIFKDSEMTELATYNTDYGFVEKEVDPSVSMFIPAAGYFNGSSHKNAGSSCDLRSSSLSSDNPENAWRLNFDSGGIGIGSDTRYHGFSVRAVQNVSNS